MASTFIVDIEESNGDVVDRRYYAGRLHALMQLESGSWVIPLAAREAIAREHAGDWHATDGGFSWGDAPCAASDADYIVYCACGCGYTWNDEGEA